MKKIIILLSIMTAVFVSCNKHKEADPLTCNLQTVAAVFIENQITVSYTLQSTGEATLTSFFYYDESGRVDIDNPATPYEITVNLSEQKTLSAGAAGKVRNGFIAVAFEAIGDSAVYSGSDRCEQQSQ